MENLPLMTVSGIRGIVGQTLTDELCGRIAFLQTKAAGGGTVVVGRDTRPSGEALARAIFKGIRAADGMPVDIGIAPTPTTCVATAELKASAGVIITASHNPSPYNGYKMVHGSGRLYNAGECQQVYDAFCRNEAPPWEEIGRATDESPKTVDAGSRHVERILKILDVETIRRAGIRVAIDSTNGAGGAVFPTLLEKLGVHWTGVHNDLSGTFDHNPEPRPENLTDLAALLATTSDLWGGFAFDPDADRLAPMGENGEPISEEMTLALALDAVLPQVSTPVATNLSTSMVVDDVARSHGVEVFRTKIGEANVVEGMTAGGCAIGGEGNGGVIYPRVATVRDGLTALGLILQLMATRGKALTKLVAHWPSYAIVKSKIPMGDHSAEAVIDSLGAKFASEEIDRQDGLKIIRARSWVHIRPSNTEPILRCIAEAPTEKEARDLTRLIMTSLDIDSPA